MDHKKWEAYLSICRKIETQGRNADGCEDQAIISEQRGFVDRFQFFLPPTSGARPARVLAPGAVSEALLLAAAGYETHALVLGPDNVKWIEDRRAHLPRPELLIPREMDGHDLDYPRGFFDGYFTAQVNEHWLSPFVHIGEVRFCSRDGAIVFVDACGQSPACSCKMIWHTNLVPERTVLDQWEFWGFKERWRGPFSDQRPQFVFEMLPMGHPEFVNSGYLQWVMRLRAGETIQYDYHCKACGR